MNPDLELIDTDELVDELSRRFDALVFAGLQHRGDTKFVYHHRATGGFVPALGLIEYLRVQVGNSLVQKDGQIPPWMEI